MNGVASKKIEPTGEVTTPSPSKLTTAVVVAKVTLLAAVPSFDFENNCLLLYTSSTPATPFVNEYGYT